MMPATPFFIRRFPGVLLILALSLGEAPAYALRPRPDEAGLEEKLTEGQPIHETDSRILAAIEAIAQEAKVAPYTVTRRKKANPQVASAIKAATGLPVGLEEKVAETAIRGSWGGDVILEKVEAAMAQLGGLPESVRRVAPQSLVEMLENINKWGYDRRIGHEAEAERFETHVTLRRFPDRLVVQINDQMERPYQIPDRTGKPRTFKEAVETEPPWEQLITRSEAGQIGGWGLPILHGYFIQGRLGVVKETFHEAEGPERGNRLVIDFPFTPRLVPFHWVELEDFLSAYHEDRPDLAKPLKDLEAVQKETRFSHLFLVPLGEGRLTTLYPHYLGYLSWQQEVEAYLAKAEEWLKGMQVRLAALDTSGSGPFEVPGFLVRDPTYNPAVLPVPEGYPIFVGDELIQLHPAIVVARTLRPRLDPDLFAGYTIMATFLFEEEATGTWFLVILA